MNDNSSLCASFEQNLLFGILALRSEFIDPNVFVGSLNAWLLDKSKPLGQILREQGKLTYERRIMIQALVEEQHEEHAKVERSTHSAISRQQGALGSPQHASGNGSSDTSLLLSAFRRAPSEPCPSPSKHELIRARFRVLRPHAKGGLGEISIAQDQELDREVALKEIQPEHANEPAFRSRFVREARITGGLEHPSIVPIYSLGAHADGRPYYAMRFVNGVTLKEAIDRFHKADVPERDNRSLKFRQLLRRFLDMCNAVAYAHSRGVLHRDLKPGNVMLGSFGETLIVDWGLAKPAEAENSEFSIQSSESLGGNDVIETEPGAAVGTPAYMSPEQAAGQVDQLGPPTDIYSLGATLYTMLTGQPPYSFVDRGELLHAVQNGEFARPRQVKDDVPTALEAICVKAMAVNPADRYASALDLAADVEHWLADEPVAAYRGPWQERTRRFLRKHRTLATSAVAMLVVAVLMSSGAAVLLNVARAGERQARFDESKQKDTAKSAQDQAEAVAKFLVDAFRSPDPSRHGKEIKVVEVLDRAVKKVDKEFAADPVIRGRLLDALGFTYQGLGLSARAIELLKRAVDLQSETLGRDASETISAMAHLADAYGDAGQYADELAISEELLKLRLRTVGQDHQETVHAISRLACAYWTVGRIQDAIPHFEHLVKLIDSEPLNTSDPDTRTNLNNLAVAYHHMGRIHEAIPLFEKTLALNRTQWGPDNSETLTTMHNLASAYRNADRIADAIALFEETLRISRNRLGPEHRDTFRSVCALAQAYSGDARLHEAVAILEPAKPLATSKLGADHPLTIQLTADLAAAYRDLGRPSEAVPLMEEAFRLTRIKHGPDHPRTLVAMTNLAGMYRGASRSNEEASILEDALARWRRVAPDSPDFALTLFNFGTTLSGQMKLDRAERAFREVLVILEKNRPAYPLRFSAQIKLGQLLVKQRKYDDAEPLLLAGYEGLRAQPKLHPAARQHVKEAVEGLVKLYEATDRHEKAAEWRGKDAPPDS